MFSMVSKILGVIALTGWMGVANATLIFDFSWDGSNGKIIGEIYGLSDDGGIMGATGVVVTSVGGMQVNINVFEGVDWHVNTNIFEVKDGELIDARFSAWAFHPEYREISMEAGTSSAFTDYFYFDGTDFYGAGSGLFVKRVTVPEPSSVILMLLGLAGLSFARYRKQY
jgi:hypothetical protein